MTRPDFELTEIERDIFASHTHGTVYAIKAEWHGKGMATGTGYVPPHLAELVDAIEYKPRWMFYLDHQIEPDGSGGLSLHVISDTEDSFHFGSRIRVNHAFLVPMASYNRDVWAAWLFDRIRDVETHEAGEFFRINGVREFAPHHSNGEDPYRVWHVSDWATAAKSSGDPT